jgi:D-alanyl-D-alanine carboxypeptidase
MRLPPGVAAALDRSKLPRDAFVAMVQEVGAGSAAPRLTWRSEQPVNPASLMKLLTSYAALETLGQAWSWTTPVWLQGPLRDGVLDGNLVIKGSGDPKLVVERVWLLLRRVQQLGVREIRGDIVLDRSAFAVPEQNPADFDGDGLRPYNVGADALLLNYKADRLHVHAGPARGVATIAPDVPLAGVRMDCDRAAERRPRATTGAARCAPTSTTLRATRSPAATRPRAASAPGPSRTPTRKATTSVRSPDVARDRRPPRRHGARRHRAERQRRASKSRRRRWPRSCAT